MIYRNLLESEDQNLPNRLLDVNTACVQREEKQNFKNLIYNNLINPSYNW